MTNLKNLEQVANTFFIRLYSYFDQQEAYNLDIIKEGFEKGGFHPNVVQKVTKRDIEVMSRPHAVASDLLKNITFESKDIQEMVDSTGKFKKYSPALFAYYGYFLTEMLRKAIIQDSSNPMTLDTRNNAEVLKSDFFKCYPEEKEGTFPYKFEEMEEYQRDKLLISHMATNLDKGDITITGNVGNFFALKNRGANIKLKGDCGWRSCMGMNNGIIEITGNVGHDLGQYMNGGEIQVMGNIKSINDVYTDAYGGEIYLNGRLLPKKKVMMINSQN